MELSKAWRNEIKLIIQISNINVCWLFFGVLFVQYVFTWYLGFCKQSLGDRIHTGATGLVTGHTPCQLGATSLGLLLLYWRMGEVLSALVVHIELMLTKQATYKQSSEDAISMGLGLAALLVST